MSLNQVVALFLLASLDKHALDSSRPIVALCCHERLGEGQFSIEHHSLVSFESERVVVGNGGHVGVRDLSRLDGCRLGF